MSPVPAFVDVPPVVELPGATPEVAPGGGPTTTGPLIIPIFHWWEHLAEGVWDLTTWEARGVFGGVLSELDDAASFLQGIVGDVLTFFGLNTDWASTLVQLGLHTILDVIGVGGTDARVGQVEGALGSLAQRVAFLASQTRAGLTQVVTQMGFFADEQRRVESYLANVLPQSTKLITDALWGGITTLAERVAQLENRVAIQEQRATQDVHEVIDPALAELQSWVTVTVLEPMQQLMATLAPALPALALLPALATEVGQLTERVTQVATDQEECCAASSNFEKNNSDLLNKLKGLDKLFDLLNKLDTAALLAALYALYAGGPDAIVGLLEDFIGGNGDGIVGTLTGWLD